MEGAPQGLCAGTRKLDKEHEIRQPGCRRAGADYAGHVRSCEMKRRAANIAATPSFHPNRALLCAVQQHVSKLRGGTLTPVAVPQAREPIVNMPKKNDPISVPCGARP
jgi:hypothetical protein